MLIHNSVLFATIFTEVFLTFNSGRPALRSADLLSMFAELLHLLRHAMRLRHANRLASLALWHGFARRQRQRGRHFAPLICSRCSQNCSACFGTRCGFAMPTGSLRSPFGMASHAVHGNAAGSSPKNTGSKSLPHLRYSSIAG